MQIFKQAGTLPAPENSQSWICSGQSAYSIVNNYTIPAIYLMPRPANGKYDIHADFDFRNTNLDQNVGLIFGYSLESYWLVTYSTYFKGWNLVKFVKDNGQLTLHTYQSQIIDGALRSLKIEVRSSTIRVLIDGTQRLICSVKEIVNSTTDGYYGLYSLGTGASTPDSGVHCTMLCKTNPDAPIPMFAVYGPSSVPPGFTSKPFTIYNDTDESLALVPRMEGVTFNPPTIELPEYGQATFTAKSLLTQKGQIEFVQDKGGDHEPLDFEIAFLPVENEKVWRDSLWLRSSIGPTPYVKGTGYIIDGDDHYDPEEGFINIQTYLEEIYDSLSFDDQLDFLDEVKTIEYGEQIKAAEIRFRDRAVLAVEGLPETPGVQLYHRFTTGILSSHLTDPDPKNVEAMNVLIPEGGNPAGLEEDWSHVGVQREAALFLQAIMDRYRMGLGLHSMYQSALRICLEHQRQWYYETDQYGVFLKPFMGALNCRALIAAWEEFSDPGIPPVIKRFCDYIIETCYQDGQVRYRDIAQNDPRWVPIPDLQITAAYSQQTFRTNLPPGNFTHSKIVFDLVPNDGYHLYSHDGNLITLTSYVPKIPLVVGMRFTIKPTGYATDENNGFTNELNMLIAPVFAWAYWHERTKTGNTGEKYREVFHDMVNTQPLPSYSQKVYNQCMLWITKAFAWSKAADNHRMATIEIYQDTMNAIETVKSTLISPIRVGDIVRYFEPGKSTKLGVVRNLYYRVQLFLDESDPEIVLSRYVTVNEKLLQKLDYHDHSDS